MLEMYSATHLRNMKMDTAHVFCQIGQDESNCRQLRCVLDGFLRGEGDILREEGDVHVQGQGGD